MKTIFLGISVAAALSSVMTANAAEPGKPSPRARQALQEFAACVADHSPEKSARTLHQDFTSSRYKAAMHALSANNAGCFERSGMKMRFNGLPFAGAIAERLMLRDPSPLAARLEKAGGQAEAATYSDSDKVAMCIARTDPDSTAALFKTEPGTAGEENAVDALKPAVDTCEAGAHSLTLNAASERAMLATAAYRMLTNDAS